jgi:hypothetical protein
MVKGGGAIVIEVMTVVLVEASCTVIVKEKVPALVGVPEIVAIPPEAVKLSPGGKLPAGEPQV